MSIVPILAATAVASRQCSYCGNQLDAFARYCNECGHEIPRPSKCGVGLLTALVSILIATLLFIFL